MGGRGAKAKKKSVEDEEEIEIELTNKKPLSQMSGQELRIELERFDATIDKDLRNEYEDFEAKRIKTEQLKILLDEATAEELRYRAIHEEIVEKQEALSKKFERDGGLTQEDTDLFDMLSKQRSESFKNITPAMTKRGELYNEHYKWRSEAEKAERLYKEKRKEREATVRDWFKVAPMTNPKIVIGFDTSKKELWEEMQKKLPEMELQKQFLQQVISQTGQKVEFTVAPEGGGGGVSFGGGIKRVQIGAYSSSTTPLHEYMHQAEEQLGLEERRSQKMIEFLEKKTGKKFEDIEVREWVPWVDSSGKKKKRGKLRGSKVWVPKALFPEAGSEEERKWGYMFRAYDRQVIEKQVPTKTGKTRIKRYLMPPISGRSDIYGTEVMTAGIEEIYREPVTFSKKHPEVFDIIVDLMRGKLP